MKKNYLLATTMAILSLAALLLASCSGKGIGGSTGIGSSGTTVVTGKVSLSSSVLGKAALANLDAYRFRKGGIPAPLLNAQSGKIPRAPMTGINMKLNAPLYDSAFSGATVDMYDADHPEWLYPVSSGTTANDGTYSLSGMANATKNKDATYHDGDAIPAGNYTLVAYSGFGLGQKPIVAVQSIVKNFDGTVPNVDFEILPSDVAPAVIYMFGVPKNNDGTETWGTAGSTFPANAAIQITFSMPMWRDNLSAGISISPAVPGKWSLSPDWLTATYYLDEGSQMTPGQTYTIEIKGENSGATAMVTNVYGNALKKTATGTFVAAAADTISPTVQWNSPTVIEMGARVDVTQPFRIESNEMLDVNRITLKGSPSIGVKSGVLYLGKNAAGLYVYEFILGEPLILDTAYTLTVKGGKDLSGHTMNTLTGSVTTNDAAHTAGIDPAASRPIQNMQAQVKSVFGRWVRSLNDRNLAQWQNVMSGEFYLEYDASRGIDPQADINRDGRWSIGEFSTNLYTRVFPQWDYCGSTITGVISPTPGDAINVVPATMTADFEFKLSSSNQVSSRMCGETAPKGSFYATVKYKNGGWRIVRASVGIDTRDKSITRPSLITTKLVQSVWPFTSIVGDTEIVDGGTLSQIPTEDLRAKFSWEDIPNVTTYVLLIADERSPWNGMAIAVSKSVTSYATNSAADPFADPTTNALDVSQKFGFSYDHNTFAFKEGGRYYWEVIALASATTVADPDNPTDANFITNKSTGDLLKDISGTSKLRRFVIGGIYKELTVQVRAGSTSSTTPLKYNPGLSGGGIGGSGIGGYDAGSAYQATLTIYTHNTTTDGSIYVYGGESRQYPITFTNRQATVTISLYNGFNYVQINETPWTPTSLSTYFTILTLGGKPPVIGIWEVRDDIGNVLSGNTWKYYTTTTGAKKVSVLGVVNDMTVTNISMSLWNEFGPSYSINSLPTSTASGDNLFTTADVTTSPTPPDLDIYKGNNYLYLSACGNSTCYNTQMVVYTDTGSVWVPPILISNITGTDSTITKKAEYSSGSDWDAALGAAANYTVALTGAFKIPGTGRYSVSSDGGYSSGSLVSNASGTFTQNILLYNGWNYIYLNDPPGTGYYYVSIFTATGKPVIKPKVTAIDGNTFSGSTYTTSRCYATVSGTSEPGTMYMNWQNYDGNSSYYDSLSMQNADGTFSFVVPLLSTAAGAANSASNMVSINDANYRSTSVTITTSGNCPYVPPSSTLTSVMTSTNLTLTASGNQYNAGTSPTVRFTGTTTRPGATITIRASACSQDEAYTTKADANGDWSIAGVKIYGTTGYSYIYFTVPGNNISYIYMTNNNSVTLTPRLQITSVVSGGTSSALAVTTNGCGYSYRSSAGAATIDISGTSSLLNGTGYYTDTVNQYLPVATDAIGAFKISGVKVYEGSNNTISLNMTDAAGSSYNYLYITSANGTVKPQVVTITSPVHGATGITGVQTVTGTIQDALNNGFTASRLTAYVYSAGTTKYYSNQSYAGYLPITYDSTNGAFSFSADFGSVADYAYVQVYATDTNLNQSHFDRVMLNVTGYDHVYAKPGTGTIVRDPHFGDYLMFDALRMFEYDLKHR